MAADLLVTDKRCKKAWSVQVKTISSKAKYWPVNPDARRTHSRSHIYVFVLAPRKSQREPSFYVVPSNAVAPAIKTFHRLNSTWYGYAPRAKDENKWTRFGGPTN